MTPSLNEARTEHPEASGHRPASQSPILRGAFVHRMGENLDDERMAAKFWTSRGFEAESIEDSSDHFSRRPDLRLLRDGKPWAYCEVKTVWRHRWTVHILHEDRAEEMHTELSKKSVEERISGDLVTAARQLRAENSDHALLNIVLLINRDPDASLQILSRVLTAQPPKVRRSLKARHDAMLAEDVQQFRHTVDFCLWANAAEDRELAVEGYFLFNPGLRKIVGGLNGLGKDKLVSLEPAA